MMPTPPVSLWPDPDALGAVTDLYQVAMMAGHLSRGTGQSRATFELFFRRLPEGRSYLVFAGLEQAIGDLLNLRFSDEQIDYFRGLPMFSRVDHAVFASLREIRFEGDVWSVPEGTVVFPNEPLLRVEGPLVQAQWVETFLIASLCYPTLVASKAARIVEAARGRPVFEFGARRGHGPHAGFLAARAAYVSGFAGTSHVEAARRLGIPCVGTMAHSWVQSFPTEAEAFAAFASTFPDATTLLVDTYDTEAGIRHAAAIEPPVKAIRIDSGDLGALAILARKLLDESGRRGVQVVASGDLDEWRIDRLLAAEAPIDAFGVGTELVTSRDAPALSMVYKLVALDGQGRVKRSPGKKTYPLAKQVYRLTDADGRFARDHVTRHDERADGQDLLGPVVRGGKLSQPLPDLDAIRRHCRGQLDRLPDRLRGVDAKPGYPISYSESLDREAARLGLI
jgi:nicotinate phosphoribosyltransferase